MKILGAADLELADYSVDLTYGFVAVSATSIVLHLHPRVDSTILLVLSMDDKCS